MRWEHRGEQVVYDLDGKNYNDLVSRVPEANPFILILLCLPREVSAWLVSGETELTLRHSCYWYRPQGEAVPNQSSKRVLIPRSNLLTTESVTALLAELRRQEIGA